MERLRWALAIVMVGAFLGTGATAQPRPGNHKPPSGSRLTPSDPKAPEKKPILHGEQAEMAEVCGLTEAQQLRVAQLNTERQRTLDRFEESNRKKIAAIQADLDSARRKKDKKASDQAAAELNVINNERGDIYRGNEADIVAVLTPQQQATWNEARAMKALAQQFSGIEFTPEQKARLRSAYLQAVAGSDASADNVRRQVTRQLAELLHKELLTEDQKLLLALQPVLGRYRKITFSDQQLERTKALYRELLAAKTPDIRTTTIQSKTVDYINKSVLTDEQLKAMGIKKD